ncbi:MAG: rRNA maturation RNase YbeY [Actinobacteria bacterium]|nr:rRNA maturation RNase YbeY [Actinomycetota bacterium]
MAILISNNQDIPVDEDQLRRIAELTLAKEGIEKEAELSIALVSEEEMLELNARYRGKDYPTDVLSFQAETPLGGKIEKIPHLLGDVVICPSVAARQAEEYGHTFDQEIELLLVHGILHLLGYDHKEDAEAEEMEEREQEILSTFFGKTDLTRFPEGGFEH